MALYVGLDMCRTANGIREKSEEVYSTKAYVTNDENAR
jgi:hypothetical protein